MAATVTHLQDADRSDSLNGTLTRHLALRWETWVFLIIFVLALFTRLFMLGERAMSHDESLHVYYSYNLYTRGDFDHTPLMHGPILFHATALSYSLFGDNDFTGRLYAALLGIGMVMSPLLFRKWLGRWGTILASAMILISPLLMYYNRYIREDTPAIMASILMAWAALTYISGPESERRRPRYLYILSAAMLWNLGSKETAFFCIAIFGAFLTLYWLLRMAQTRWNIAARQWMHGALMAMLVGGVIAVGMYAILDITPLDVVSNAAQTEGLMSNVESRSFVYWTRALFITVVAAFAGTMLWAFRNRLRRVPWREFAIVTVAALAVTGGFIIIEERSHVAPGTLGLAQPLDPSAVDENGGVNGGAINWLAVAAPWLLMIGTLVILVLSRRKNAEGRDWWDWLNQFPELDVLWVMGTLVLPWITAVFIIGARGTEADYVNLGSSFGFLTGLLPVTGAMQTGQFVLGFLCWLPLMITSIAAGIAWNWRRFAVCWLIFHALFAFFFTTVFTNIQGFATGMVGSLQYWLEQQGERRGSQPQYYYTLIVLPMYEFLPIIGSIIAALTGSHIFWWRRRRILELEAEESAAEKQKALLEGQAVAENPDEGASLLTTEEASVAPPLPGSVADIETHTEQIHRELRGLQTLTEVPFLLFVSFWAVLNLIVFTLAGEKMPWLGTHMTLPMILLTAWYFGRLIDRIDWATFLRSGWMNLLLYPLLLAAVFQLVVQQVTGQRPFQGVTQEQLQLTYQWIAAAVVAIAVAWALTRVRRLTGNLHARQIFATAVFGVLGVVTFRSAWMASFINFDYPNEFLVYAHATNGTKEMMNWLEDLSRRTTDGLGIPFAYDHKLSWPGAWYFRHYTGALYMGATPTLQMMEDKLVVIVGDENRSVVEPLLEDRYQRFDFKRMWWPMQEYFYMNATRMIDLFDLTDAQSAQMRLGIWDIWWQRDYTTYGQATNKTFTFDRWPVSENMYMYVRRDFAAQVWPYGIGDGSVTNPIAEVEVSPCVANWQQYPALAVFDTSALPGGALTVPIGVDVTGDGRVLVAEDQGYRISEFTLDGQYVRSFGQRGPADMGGAFFDRPHSVEAASDGSIVVVDTWNYRIRVFSPQLEQLTAWGQGLTVGINAPAEPLEGFWGPRDIAIGPDDLVYIADTGNKRVRVYMMDGTWVRDIGRGGSGSGQLDEPTGIVIHPDGRVFIADTWNRRISVFTVDGTFVTTYPLRAWYDLNQSASRPYLALDAERDYLYVPDPDGGRVLVMTTAGECLGAFGRLNRESPNSSEFDTIGGIDVDSEGNVYVADPGTGRLLKFAPFPEPVIDPNTEDQDSQFEAPPGIGVPQEPPPAETEEPVG